MSESLLHAVVSAVHLGGHRLHLRFDDGTEGDVDLERLIQFRGLLAPLSDPAYVALVAVEAEHGTVTWPNGADVDEVILYCAARGIPVPTYRDEAPEEPKSGQARRLGRAASPTTKGSRKAGG